MDPSSSKDANIQIAEYKIAEMAANAQKETQTKATMYAYKNEFWFDKYDKNPSEGPTTWMMFMLFNGIRSHKTLAGKALYILTWLLGIGVMAIIVKLATQA